MDFLRAAIERSQENVTGEVRGKLYQGHGAGHRPPLAGVTRLREHRHLRDCATDYRQSDATGFIRIQGQQLRPRGRDGKDG